MRKVQLGILIMLAGIALWQCSRTPQTTAPVQPPDLRTPAELNASEKNLAGAVNTFSFRLFKAVNDNTNPDRNVFLSPLSVSYALGMLKNGANGTTRSEIDSILGTADISIDDANRAYKSLTAILMAADSAVTFEVANSFWSQEGLEVKPSFTDACREYFEAQAQAVDFGDPATAELINDWVSEHTRNLITKIVEAPLPSDMAAILLNALYFKGAWTFPFDTARTLPGQFMTPNGSRVECQYMTKMLADDAVADTALFAQLPPVAYADSTCLVLTLPYGRQGFRISLALPRGTISADALIADLTQEKWSSWLEWSRPTHLWFSLPKFEYEFETSLKRILIDLGMPTAFSGAADFSNLFQNTGTSISEVKHKAFIKVDEKGTEAAAVTSIGLVVTNSAPMMFSKPFVLVIHELESGTVLFMGKVVNPALKS